MSVGCAVLNYLTKRLLFCLNLVIWLHDFLGKYSELNISFSLLQGISTDGCGNTVGCLRFQSRCSGSSCQFVATYKYQPSTNLVMFEMFGKNADWVAIGFSDNKEMVWRNTGDCMGDWSNISNPKLRTGQDLKS
jgi:hypothetical protein